MTILKSYGFRDAAQTYEQDGLLVGRVTEQHRDRYTIITEQGEVKAVLRGAFYYESAQPKLFPCVGDFVLLHFNAMGDYVIESVLSRYSMFSRADYAGHDAGYAKHVQEQVVASNFDYVFILCSLNLDFNVNRVMRYITQARQSGALPVVVLTKADLVEDYSTQVTELIKLAPEVPVHPICSHTGLGLDELSAYLEPFKTIVFLGMSGVGKSSLINALMNDDVMKVQNIRESDSRGRHTTTHRQLFMLSNGAMVIDTPGMRELGLIHADNGLSEGFADIEALFTACCFSDCTHQSEPDCGVLAALSDGTLDEKRWELYMTQQQEIRFVENKSMYLIEKRAKNKGIAMWSKQMRKKRGKGYDN